MSTRPYGWSARRRWLALIIALATVAAALLTVSFRRSSDLGRASSRHQAAATPQGHPTSPRETSDRALPPTPAPRLAATDDPNQYAKEVATALFAVSPERTTREDFLQLWRDELPTVVYSDASAKGLTLARQNADAMQNLTTWWVPSPAAWTSEARDHTVNRFEVTSVSVPDYWADAVAEGRFRDSGLHLERIMGVLAQSYGSDPQHRYQTSRAIVIDLALLCGPTQVGGCRLVAPQQPSGSGSG